MKKTTKIKRNADGSLNGITTMGDVLKKDEPTPEMKQLEQIKQKFEIRQIVQLAIAGKNDLVLAEIKKSPPSMINDFIDEIQNEGKDFVDDFFLLLTDDQRKEWNWLASAERERDYILSIPDEKLTDQDRFNLKGCDI